MLKDEVRRQSWPRTHAGLDKHVQCILCWKNRESHRDDICCEVGVEWCNESDVSSSEMACWIFP